jgi:hypothetical protein
LRKRSFTSHKGGYRRFGAYEYMLTFSFPFVE